MTNDLDFACEMTRRDVALDPKSPTQPTQGIPQSNVYSEILDGEDYKWAFDTSFSDVPHSWGFEDMDLDTHPVRMSFALGQSNGERAALGRPQQTEMEW